MQFKSALQDEVLSRDDRQFRIDNEKFLERETARAQKFLETN